MARGNHIEVNWVDGRVRPKDFGEYYVILALKKDMKTLRKLGEAGEQIHRRAGDVEMHTWWWFGEYEPPEGDVETLSCDFLTGWCGHEAGGDDDDIYRIVAWAPVPLPEAPSAIRPKLRDYFGQKADDHLNWMGDEWLTRDAAKEADDG